MKPLVIVIKLWAHKAEIVGAKLKRLPGTLFTENTLSHSTRGSLMVSALDSRSKGRSGHYVVFLGKTVYSHGASLHPDV